MRYAISTRYLRLVDAQSAATNYEDYLRLGLKCAFSGCSARVFFTSASERAAHTRTLASGKSVEVVASSVSPHFTCFASQDCLGSCDRSELSKKEVHAQRSSTKNQRLKKIWIHLLEMHRLGILGECNSWETEDYFKVVKSCIPYFDWESILAMANEYFRFELTNIKLQSSLIIDCVVREAKEPGTITKRIKPSEAKDVNARLVEIKDWLIDMEVDLHKQHVAEVLEFLSVRRSRPLFDAMFVRGVFGWLSYLNQYSVESASLTPSLIVQTGVDSLLSSIATTYWARNWELVEQMDAAKKNNI